MKSILILLLTCSICLSAFAQIDTSKKTNPGNSDKWVITPVKNMKGVLGQLDMNFPAGLDWNIGNLAITRQADNKHITSFSGLVLRTKKSYNIAPDEYLIHLNNLPIENVPIQKGQVTKLKVGFLKVTAEERWEIYNETKDRYFTSYNKPLNFAVPVGSYQLYTGGQYYPVLITEGKTSVAPSSNDNSIREAENITTNPVAEIIDLPDETEYYIVKPGGNIPAEKGRLYIDLDLSLYEATIFAEPEYTLGIETTNSGEKVPIDLAPGIYGISFGGIPRIRIPIHKEKKTRLKAGYLKITVDYPWKLDRVSGHINVVSAIYSPHRTLALPPGQYTLVVIPNPNYPNQNVFYDITIKDGGLVINGRKRD